MDYNTGSITERVTEPVWAGAVCWVGPLMLNLAVETDILLFMRPAFWIALLVLSSVIV
jgi:hypothetical protein